MSFTLCLQIPNHLRFNWLTDFYHRFIPQTLFLQLIFSYLVRCIIYKWLVDLSQLPMLPLSLLNMLIVMFLSPGTNKEGMPLYHGQGFVQMMLLLIMAVCVPWVLCFMPHLLWKEKKHIRTEDYTKLGAANDGYGMQHEDLEGKEEGHGGAIVADTNEEHISLMALCFLFSLFLFVD